MAAPMTFGNTLAQLWSTVGTILSAIEFFAKGAKNLGEWTDETTAAFVDESRIDRQKKLAKMNAELEVEQNNATALAKQSSKQTAKQLSNTATSAP